MKRYTLIVFSLLFGGIQATAQSLPEAIKKTDNERYEEAAKEFRTLISQNPVSVGDAYFFYGENYFQSDDLDSAKIIWKKGLDLDPENALAQVGQGKSLWLSGDTTAASAIFQTVLKNTKRKNAEVIRQIASVFVNSPQKSLNQAVGLLNEAIKLEPKNQFGYLLLGDAQVEINPRNSSEAMKSYNQASDINNNARVFVRRAKIYQRAQNPKLADSLYEIAQNIEPSYAPSYRERAELNMRFNQVNQSIKNWEKYLQLNNSDYARYRYATSLFLGKKYEDAVREVNTLHANGFKNVYTSRIKIISIYENNIALNADSTAYKKGMEVIVDFFKTAPADKIIGLDYKYKALYHEKLNQKEQYLTEMEKAADTDKSIAEEIYGDLAKYYMKEKNYDQAIALFNKKMAGDSSKLTLAEYYELGRAYYFGPKDYAKVDGANAHILTLSPEYAMSFLWRARANVQMDLEKVNWSAKPHYEGFLNLLKEEEKAGQYKSMAIEAYKYLGDFYVNSPEKNIDKAKEVWGAVQILSPDDAQAKAFFASVK
jgi:tetratricopeptide (TPR) repeat protein